MVIYSGTSLESFGRRPRFRGSVGAELLPLAPLPLVTDVIVGLVLAALSLSLPSDIL